MSNSPLQTSTDAFLAQAEQIRQGGGPKGIDRQHRHGRLTARERIDLLIDPGSSQLECGLFSAWEMYKEFGGAPAAGVVTTIASVGGKICMIIANDATVKAGAFFPMTCKKIIRAQEIAQRARLPLLYLVDSAGVFLPLQEDVFPDTDDFGRIFRNNAVISANGISQIAAIMGNCVAGGGYLPVLCDTLLMTEGSGLYLAGPAWSAAIGWCQHRGTRRSRDARLDLGTIDFMNRMMKPAQATPWPSIRQGHPPVRRSIRTEAGPEEGTSSTSSPTSRASSTTKELLECVIDDDSFNEYKRTRASIVCGYARSRMALRHRRQPAHAHQADDAWWQGWPSTSTSMPAVIYTIPPTSPTPIMINQRHPHRLRMTRRDSWSVAMRADGIIRSAPRQNASNDVPKISLITGGSRGQLRHVRQGVRSIPHTYGPVVDAVMVRPARDLQRPGARNAEGGPDEVNERCRRHHQVPTINRTFATVRRGWIDRMIHPQHTRRNWPASSRIDGADGAVVQDRCAADLMNSQRKWTQS